MSIDFKLSVPADKKNFTLNILEKMKSNDDKSIGVYCKYIIIKLV